MPDEDSNLIRDAPWHYLWDAENRLARMEIHERGHGPRRYLAAANVQP